MPENTTPGVYIEEIPHLPPSIASVETAIPAFIGYTQKAQNKEPDDLRLNPFRIESMLEYEQYFGKPAPEKDSLSVAFTQQAGATTVTARAAETSRSKYLMHYSLQLFFANGGGPCWIISAGDYASAAGIIEVPALLNALTQAATINEITLLLFPDAANIDTAAGYYPLYSAAIEQSAGLKDRFTLLDVYHVPEHGDEWEKDISLLRTSINNDTGRLKYAAAYFPRIFTNIAFFYSKDGPVDYESFIKIEGGPAGIDTLAALKTTNNTQYLQAKKAISAIPMLLPVSPAMAGIYASIDNARGVWKAPANINISNALQPQYLVTKTEQEDLNVDVIAGKSVNVIRKLEGRGPAIVWGARTLDGNSNEWRYISIRRFCNMVEESVKNATEQFVFEPNDQNTWVRIQSMVNNYLTQQWRAGALMGSTTKEAFFVHTGLGETMTELDIQQGRMIIEIGMAVARPAEFIILRFMHKMLAES